MDRACSAARRAPRVELRLLLPAGDLVVRSDSDVHASGNDGVLEEPGPRLRIQSNVEVSKEVLRSLRLFPLGPDEILVLRRGEFHHPAPIESDSDVADPSAEPGDGPVEDNRSVPGLLIGDDERFTRGNVSHILSDVKILLCNDAVLDPRRFPDEVAREPRSIRMRDLDPPLLRQRTRHLAPRAHHLLTVYAPRLTHHTSPLRARESLRTSPAPG